MTEPTAAAKIRAAARRTNDLLEQQREILRQAHLVTRGTPEAHALVRETHRIMWEADFVRNDLRRATPIGMRWFTRLAERRAKRRADQRATQERT